MILDWYLCFIAAVLVLWAISTPQDKAALRIVLIASLVSEALVDFITSQIHGSWKLVIPGALEVLTILALMQWAKNRTGYLNSGLLCIAWLAHILCYVDLWLKTDIVYSRYEAVIQLVALGQLASCYDTVQHNLGRAYLWASGLRRVHASSNSAAVLHPESTTDLQTP